MLSFVGIHLVNEYIHVYALPACCPLLAVAKTATH